MHFATLYWLVFGAVFAQEPSPLEAVRIASGLVRPTNIVSARDGSGRLFFTEQAGVIRVLAPGEYVPQPFLDIADRVRAIDPECCDERGLLGLAFAPDFAQTGTFFVNYLSRDGFTVTSRFRTTADGSRGDPDSEFTIFRIAWDSSNHNGGQLAFGPDGALYLSLGDGVVQDSAQDPASYRGKIIRFEVGKLAFQPKVWAMGLRNPWRFSFDRETGDLYIGDVGADSREEVNVQPGGLPGANFGWPLREGTLCFGLLTCTNEAFTDPVASYSHDDGCAVTGGYVYRGKRMEAYAGVYFYADFCTGRVWSLRRTGDEWMKRLEMDQGFTISTFGEDEDGEIYFTNYLAGDIFRIQQR